MTPEEWAKAMVETMMLAITPGKLDEAKKLCFELQWEFHFENPSEDENHRAIVSVKAEMMQQGAALFDEDDGEAEVIEAIEVFFRKASAN